VIDTWYILYDRLIDEGNLHVSPPALSPPGSPSLDNRELLIYQARRTDLHGKMTQIQTVVWGKSLTIKRERKYLQLTG
jgi:hypothetical protein